MERLVYKYVSMLGDRFCGGSCTGSNGRRLGLGNTSGVRILYDPGMLEHLTKGKAPARVVLKQLQRKSDNQG